MSTTLLVIFCQTTCVMAIGLLTLHLLRNRHVQLAANIGNLTAISAALLVLASCFGLPRPLSIRLAWPVESPAQNHRSMPDLLQESRLPGDAAGAAVQASAPPLQSVAISLPMLQIGAQRSTGIQPQSQLAATFNRLDSWANVIAILGVCLCGLILIRLSLGIYTAIRLTTQAVNLPRWQWPCEVQKFHSQYAQHRSGVRLKVHPAIDSPCVHAFGRNTIFVPPAFLTWSQEEAVAAFAHEFSHLRRRDSYWRLMGELCLSVVALHPLAHWMRRKIIMTQEVATDLMATDLLGSSDAYKIGLSRLLLRLDSQANKVEWRLGYGGGVSVFSSSLIRRIEMLGQAQEFGGKAKRKLRLFFLATACIGVGVSGSWGVVADEPTRVATLSNATAEQLPVRPDEKVTSVLPEEKAVADETVQFLAGRKGFLRVDVAAARKHPLSAMGINMLQLFLDTQLPEPVDGERPSSTDYGLALNEIQWIEVGLLLHADLASSDTDDQCEPADEANDFALTQWSLRADSIRIKSQQIVDWPKLIFELLDSDGESLACDKELPDSVQPSNLLSVGKWASEGGSTSSVQNATADNPELATIWKACDGGFFTAAGLIDESGALKAALEDLMSSENLTETQKRSLSVVSSVSAVGLGVGLEPGKTTIACRLVVQGRAGVDDEQLLDLVSDTVTDFQASELENGAEEHSEDGQIELADILKGASIEMISGPNGESLVEVRLDYDPIIALMMNN